LAQRCNMINVDIEALSFHEMACHRRR
jgi:hypothetical protein